MPGLSRFFCLGAPRGSDGDWERFQQSRNNKNATSSSTLEAVVAEIRQQMRELRASEARAAERDRHAPGGTKVGEPRWQPERASDGSSVAAPRAGHASALALAASFSGQRAPGHRGVSAGRTDTLTRELLASLATLRGAREAGELARSRALKEARRAQFAAARAEALAAARGEALLHAQAAAREAEAAQVQLSDLLRAMLAHVGVTVSASPSGSTLRRGAGWVDGAESRLALPGGEAAPAGGDGRRLPPGEHDTATSSQDISASARRAIGAAEAALRASALPARRPGASPRDGVVDASAPSPAATARDEALRKMREPGVAEGPSPGGGAFSGFTVYHNSIQGEPAAGGNDSPGWRGLDEASRSADAGWETDAPRAPERAEPAAVPRGERPAFAADLPGERPEPAAAPRGARPEIAAAPRGARPEPVAAPRGARPELAAAPRDARPAEPADPPARPLPLRSRDLPAAGRLRRSGGTTGIPAPPPATLSPPRTVAASNHRLPPLRVGEDARARGGLGALSPPGSASTGAPSTVQTGPPSLASRRGATKTDPVEGADSARPVPELRRSLDRREHQLPPRHLPLGTFLSPTVSGAARAHADAADRFDASSHVKAVLGGKVDEEFYEPFGAGLKHENDLATEAAGRAGGANGTAKGSPAAAAKAAGRPNAASTRRPLDDANARAPEADDSDAATKLRRHQARAQEIAARRSFRV